MTRNGRRRKRQRNAARLGRNLFDLLKMAAVVAVVAFIAIMVIRWTSNGSGVISSTETYLEGVYVNGVSLAGYTKQEGIDMMDELIDKRLNQDAFELVYGDKVWTLTPGMLNATLDVRTQMELAWNFGHTGSWSERRSQSDYLKDNIVEYNSELEYDETMLDQFIAQIKSEIDVAPVDADIIVDTDEILTVTPSSTGLSLDAEALKQTLEDAMVKGTTMRIELQPAVVQPTYTTEDMQSCTELIATCETSTKGSNDNRVRNIMRALKAFNGVRLNPNETMSFNEMVGKRTVENGFYEGQEFLDGEVVMGIGGGTCQASTTLYGALVRAGMTVEVRYQHSLLVSYIRPSLDATVTDTGKDLVFTNDTDYPIFIYTSVDNARAEVRIFGKQPEYEIKFVSEIISRTSPSGYEKKADTEGKYVWYTTDEPVLAEEGKDGLKSQGVRELYDRETGELVERDVLSSDSYSPIKPVYWVGVHEPDF